MGSSVKLAKYIRNTFNDTDIASHFLFHAEREVARAGVTLSIEHDFNDYVETNRRNQKSWFAPMPMFDPKNGEVERAFWIRGVTREGETVIVQAARCFGLMGSNLAEAIASLEIFYNDPAVSASPIESCSCDAPSASRISGTVCYSGGGWFHRDYRGRQFSTLMPRISRALAFSLWHTHYTVSFVEPVLVERGVVQRYGYQNIEPGIEWRNAKTEPRLSLSLIWMDRCEMLWGLCNSMELAEEVRVTAPKRQLQRASHS